MLRKRDVMVGRVYVNNERKIARKVLKTSKQTVTFNTYHLDTGYSCGSPSEWTVQVFMRWAEDEASPAVQAFLEDRDREVKLYEP